MSAPPPALLQSHDFSNLAATILMAHAAGTASPQFCDCKQLVTESAPGRIIQGRQIPTFRFQLSAAGLGWVRLSEHVGYFSGGVLSYLPWESENFLASTNVEGFRADNSQEGELLRLLHFKAHS
jgi:hypothetical protein